MNKIYLQRPRPNGVQKHPGLTDYAKRPPYPKRTWHEPEDDRGLILGGLAILVALIILGFVIGEVLS